MSLSLRPQEAALDASLDTLSPTQLAPELRRVLAAARPLPYYVGSAALAGLTYNVALELVRRGVPVDALPLFREALAELTATVGADHKLTTQVASNLGLCLNDLGQNEEALPLLERACMTQLMDKDKKLALFTIGKLACVRRALGNLDGAAALLRQGSAMLARLAVAAGLAPGAPPPELLSEWTSMKLSLSQLHEECKRFEDAEVVMRESLASLAGLAVCDEAADNVSFLTLMLASILWKRKDLLAAEKLYRELLPKLQGKQNYSVVAHGLGMVLQERGLVTESRKYLNIAQDATRTGYGAGNSITQKSQQLRSDLEASLLTCARCGSVTDKDVVMKVCQGCKAARYCGPACARLHWKAHKKECRRIEAESKQVAAGCADGAGPSNA